MRQFTIEDTTPAARVRSSRFRTRPEFTEPFDADGADRRGRASCCASSSSGGSPRPGPSSIAIEAGNGTEAVTAFNARPVDIAFLDIRMPGMTGLEVAHAIGDRAHVVFVTAYDEYAIAAFEEGAVDYPPLVTTERLDKVVARLKTRLMSAPLDLEGLLARLAGLRRRRPSEVDPRLARQRDAHGPGGGRAVLPGRGQVHEGRLPQTPRR